MEDYQHQQQEQNEETQQQRQREANSPQTQHFWFDRYEFEEADSKRTAITIAELCQSKFEQRRWFLRSRWVRRSEYAVTSDDIIESDLHRSAGKCFFTQSGIVIGFSFSDSGYNLAGSLVTLNSNEILVVCRTPAWGWQLYNGNVVLRLLDEGGKYFDPGELWKDLISTIVVQEERSKKRQIPADYMHLISW